MKLMKIKYLFMAALFILSFGFFACNQDPIFFKISQEVEPEQAAIPGSPVNFALFTRTTGFASKKLLYAASGKKLHWYTAVEGWDKSSFAVPQPGGWIKYLAAADEYLYLICYPSSAALTPELKRISKTKTTGENWTALALDAEVSEYTIFQTIFAPSRDWLFVGAENHVFRDVFTILYTNGNANQPGNLQWLKWVNDDGNEVPLGGELCGAAFDPQNQNYYLCVKGSGVAVVWVVPAACLSVPDPAAIRRLSADEILVSIISFEDTSPATHIWAMGRSGKLYDVKAAGADGKIPVKKDASGKELSMGSYSSTSLAIWEDPPAPTGTGSGRKLLLAGHQDKLEYTTTSGYTYGYRDFPIDSSNGDVSEPREPGGTFPTSTNNRERYQSSIGKHQVNFIIQAPADVDPLMTLFASTQKDGVWSYRDRDGWQWNAE